MGSIVRDAVAHPSLDLSEETSEWILIRSCGEVALAHEIERTGIVFKAFAEFLEDQKAGAIKRYIEF